MADGYVNKCKECNKLDVRENYKTNIEQYKEYEKNRSLLPHRVTMRENYSKTKAYKTSHYKSIKKDREENPKKHKARNLVRYAIANGELKKPKTCEQCDKEDTIHGHHCDYNKPLEVMWLCVKCHVKWHKNNTPIY